MKKRNKIAKDLHTTKYRNRVVKPKKGKGSFLYSVDGKKYSLEEVSGTNGLLIMFICNHCPYVLAILDRIVRDSEELQKLGIGVAAISSNDVIGYPEDSFDNMKKLATKYSFSFIDLST